MVQSPWPKGVPRREIGTFETAFGQVDAVRHGSSVATRSDRRRDAMNVRFSASL